MILHNTTTRVFNLPTWREDGLTAQAAAARRVRGGDVEESAVFPRSVADTALQPGAKLEAPDWYVKRLRESSAMMAHLIDPETGTISQQRRIGSIAQEDVAAAQRAKARKAAAELATEPQPDPSGRRAAAARNAAAKAQADDSGGGGPDAGGRTKATEESGAIAGGRKRG